MRTSLWKRSAQRVRGQWTNLNDAEFRRAVVHDLIETQVSDVLQATSQRLHCPLSPWERDGVRGKEPAKSPHPNPLPGGEGTIKPFIAPSTEIAEQKREMGQFLMEHVYRHPNVMVHRRRVAGWIETIFDHYVSQPERLPERYSTVIQQEGAKRAAADYVADQTDRSIRSELLKLNPRQVAFGCAFLNGGKCGT